MLTEPIGRLVKVRMSDTDVKKRKEDYPMVETPFRSQSPFQVLNNAYKITKKFVVLLYSDFGMTNKEASDPVGSWTFEKPTVKTITEFDAKTSKNIAGMSAIIEFENEGKVFLSRYQTWILNKYRDAIWKEVQELSENIRMANTINPITVSEYEERRNRQNMALSTCFVLLDLCQQLIEILKVKPSKLTDIVALLYSEVEMIKGWRKSDYKKLLGCMKSEKKMQAKALAHLRRDIIRKMKKHPEMEKLLPVLNDLENMDDTECQDK